MAAPTLSEELYFGSVDVSFSATPGQAFASPPNTWSDLVSVGSKSVANARFEMAQWLGDGYSTLVLPAIPATDPVLDTNAGTFRVLLAFGKFGVPEVFGGVIVSEYFSVGFLG